MNETIQLLQDVVRNARTGGDAVNQLMQRAEGDSMRRELNDARTQYETIHREAERALAANHGQPEPVNPLNRAGMWMGLNMNTLMDRSDDHIAEMVIQGATMGVIEMTKSTNTYADADPAARAIASRFIVAQQGIIDKQKAYLSNRVHA